MKNKIHDDSFILLRKYPLLIQFKNQLSYQVNTSFFLLIRALILQISFGSFLPAILSKEYQNRDDEITLAIWRFAPHMVLG